MAVSGPRPSPAPRDATGDGANPEGLPDPATAASLAQRFGLEFRPSIQPHEVDSSLVVRLPIQYAKRSACLPLREEPGGALAVALADPRAGKR